MNIVRDLVKQGMADGIVGPDAITDYVISSLNGDHEAVFRYCLRNTVRIEITRLRNGPQPHDEEEPVRKVRSGHDNQSAKWATTRDWAEKRLSDQHAVDGEWKRLGHMNKKDLRWLEQDYLSQSAAFRSKAIKFRLLADALEKARKGTVEQLPLDAVLKILGES